MGRNSSVDQEILETVFEYAHDAICVVDLDTDEIIECNPAATDLFGYSREELLSMSASDLHTHNFAEYQEFTDTVNKEGSAWTNELTCYAKHGEEIPSEISATVVEVQGQTCLISVIRDISDRREREEQLQRENQRLETFAQIVSHDLRNPLNVVAGHLELVERDCESEAFEPIESALDRAFDIIDDTMVLAKQGQEVEDPESVQLASMVEQCWEGVKTKGVNLRLDGDREVIADPDRLQHLFENLFRNAVEHGGDDVTITVGTLPDGFYIADSGPGIPAEDRNQIFELGYTTADEGTGFGLTIVQQMAHAHGWSVDVTDSTTGGARFEITGIPD